MRTRKSTRSGGARSVIIRAPTSTPFIIIFYFLELEEMKIFLIFLFFFALFVLLCVAISSPPVVCARWYAVAKKGIYFNVCTWHTTAHINLKLGMYFLTRGCVQFSNILATKQSNLFSRVPLELHWSRWNIARE